METEIPLEQRIGEEAPPDYATVAANGHEPEPEHTEAPVVGSLNDAPQDGGSPTKNGGRSAHWRSQKEAKPNKVYIGGLPETTRQEDLQNCFGKLGNVTNIELKLGYGFVEFDNVKAAEEAVAKYNEGFFMGSKIKVEQSHGGGRTSKYSNDPGACFKCGQHGHWARECPTSGGPGGPGGGPGNKKFHGNYGGPRSGGHDSLLDRMNHAPKDYAPPPPRDYGRFDDYRDRERYPPPPPPRDSRFDYARPPPPRDARDYRDPRDVRLPPSPPREYRDYPGAPPPRREYDDYRRPDARGPPGAPPPPVAPPARYETRPFYPPEPPYGAPPTAAYPPRVPDYPPPPPPRAADPYAPRPYERRDSAGGAPPLPPPAGDKYGYPPVLSAGRPRSPGPPPVRGARDEYDRAPPRDYGRAPDYRARSPPPSANGGRYPEYPPRDVSNGYRRPRSPSPPRAGGSYRGYPDPKAPGGVPPYPPTNGYSEPGFGGAAAGGPGGRGPPARDPIPGRERDFRGMPPNDPGYRRP